MPKAGTAQEPADVRRAAAAEGVTTKNTPGEPVELAPTSGPDKKKDLAFFELLAAMTPREWEDRLVYLYRQDKNIIKADPKDSNYIERISHPFDEQYVKEKHGGGQYLAILKNARINGAERKHVFKIEGAPIIHDDEVQIGGKKKDAAGEKSETALLVDEVRRLTDKLLESGQKATGAEQEAISRAVGMLSEASRGALQIQQEAIKATVGSPTGNSIADKFLEKAIEKLGDENKSELDQLMKFASLLKELRGPEKAAGAGLLGNIGEIKGVLELLKDLGVKIGGGGEAAAVEGGMDWKSVLASTLPQGLQVVMPYVDSWMRQNAERNRLMAEQIEIMRRGQGQPALPPAPVPAQPVQTFAPQTVQPQQPQASALPANFAAAPMQPAANPAVAHPAAAVGEVVHFPGGQPGASTAAAGPQAQVDLDVVCLIIRRCFDAGDSGDSPAIILKRLYAEALEPFRPYLNDQVQLKMLAGMAPVLAEIVNDAEFDPFMREFVEEMNRKEDDGPEPTEPEEGKAA